MTIEFKPGRYVHGVWFASDGSKDFMGCLYRDNETEWHLMYRFRYYVDDKRFDSDDRKSWYHGTVAMPASKENEVSAKIHVAFEALAEQMMTATLGFTEFRCDGGDEKAIKLLTEQPWAHHKTVSMEEAKAMGLNVPEAKSS